MSRKIPALLRPLLLLIAMMTPPIAIADKTDVVVLINGDRVTGEVKSLEFGTLEYSTDSMGTVEIDWEDVVSVTSNQTLEVETSGGTKYYGNLMEPPGVSTVSVGRGENVEDLAKNNVVRITPIETDPRFIDRLEGNVKFGFNTDKGSSVTQSNLNASVRYRAREYLVGLTVSSTITDQPSEDTTERHSTKLNYQRFRGNRWFTDWFAEGSKNEEQGINSRFLLGGGLGRYWVQTNENQLSLLGGLVVTQETFIGDPETPTFLEGKVALNYLHRSVSPDSDVILKAEYYPLLEDLNQYRLESDLTFRREFIEDLFFDLSVYYSFLSDPPPGANSDDYGVTTSLGYKF